jgi:DHA1 family bicyclomycin/chloramphenicol resistance-like MFS transporter
MRSRPLPFVEFVALLALLFATVAFSIDAMLPVLTTIGTDLAPQDPGQAQLVVTVFVFGLGLGTLLVGPVSDAVGRKRVILAGIVLYMLAAVVAALSDSLWVLLGARMVQGLGAAAPRVVAGAMVRDLYTGRQMARVMSLAMTLFVLVPAIAPLIGAGISGLFGWRAIFWSFLVFGAISGGWLWLRQPETLAAEVRRPLRLSLLWEGLREILGNARTRLLLLALSLSFSAMFAFLATSPLIFDLRYGRGDSFPLWFAAIALVAGGASLINARLVVRLGMHRLIGAALILQILAALATLLLGDTLPPNLDFALFVLFMTVQFATVALLFGNLNAMALERLGHMAGLGASIMGGVSTMVAAVIATPVARAFDGTLVPLAGGCLALAAGALWSMSRIKT